MGTERETLARAWEALDGTQRFLVTRTVPGLAWLPGGEGLDRETHYVGFVEARTGLGRAEAGAAVLAALATLAREAGTGEGGLAALLAAGGMAVEDAAELAALALGGQA